MQPFDIFNATFPWNGCNDTRPWLVIEVRPDGLVDCFPISSQCYHTDCFSLDQGHDDFAATGLTKNCYIHDTHIMSIPAADFGKRRGALAGELLNEFKEYSGIV
jgi:hypothetical protein